MKPLISVIVPVYKVEAFLPKCLDSILAQTYENLEIILVDDGSPDNCGAICDEYAKKDSRVRVIHQENAGLAEARNSGIAIANGEFFGFVDSDDRIAPEMYETLLSCLEKENADIAICGRYLEFDSADLIPAFTYDAPKIFGPHEAVRRFLLSDGLDASAWDKLYRRDIWGDTRYPPFYVSEDVPVTSLLLANAKKIVHCGKPMYYHYQRTGSLSHAAFQEKVLGLYYFYKKASENMVKRYPDLAEEGAFFYYKSLMVVLFRYIDGKAQGPIGKELYSQLRKNLLPICRNRYLKLKYKIFALAVSVGLGGLSVHISNLLGINDNSLTK